MHCARLCLWAALCFASHNDQRDMPLPWRCVMYFLSAFACPVNLHFKYARCLFCQVYKIAVNVNIVCPRVSSRRHVCKVCVCLSGRVRQRTPRVLFNCVASSARPKWMWEARACSLVQMLLSLLYHRYLVLCLLLSQRGIRVCFCLASVWHLIKYYDFVCGFRVKIILDAFHILNIKLNTYSTHNRLIRFNLLYAWGARSASSAIIYTSRSYTRACECHDAFCTDVNSLVNYRPSCVHQPPPARW